MNRGLPNPYNLMSAISYEIRYMCRSDPIDKFQPIQRDQVDYLYMFNQTNFSHQNEKNE